MGNINVTYRHCLSSIDLAVASKGVTLALCLLISWIRGFWDRLMWFRLRESAPHSTLTSPCLEQKSQHDMPCSSSVHTIWAPSSTVSSSRRNVRKQARVMMKATSDLDRLTAWLQGLESGLRLLHPQTLPLHLLYLWVDFEERMNSSVSNVK